MSNKKLSGKKYYVPDIYIPIEWYEIHAREPRSVKKVGKTGSKERD